MVAVSADLETFWSQPTTSSELAAWIEAGLREDRAREDTASRVLFAGCDDDGRRVRATITAGADGVICGGPAVAATIAQLDATATEVQRTPEGALVAAGDRVVVVEAGVTAILAGERTALNILGHLSGIATMTASWSRECGSVALLDTRKTLPGLRTFQKFATRCGGATNHRMHLAEMPMVKENHRDLFRKLHGLDDPAQELTAVVERFREQAPGQELEIEVEDLPSFLACVELGVDWILIDNQEPATIREWVAAARARVAENEIGGLEASGGLERDVLADYAASGVDRLSVGALTHSVRALDVSLHVEWADDAR